MLDESQILNIVGQELSYSSGGNENDFIEGNRQAALAMYLGGPDGKEVEGRSTIVSTDVADAIEWIMPEIMKAFTQNNEVVTFDPAGENDADQADLESRYVYDILMKDNNGFLILHEFIKNALMQKNGFIRVHYDDNVKETTESYTGLTEPEYQMVIADKEVEVAEISVDETGEIPTFDIKVTRSKNKSIVKVTSVPPEEFRVNKMHNSLDLSTARFTGQVLIKTRSELVEEGHDKDLIYSIPASEVYENDREYRFYMQGEAVQPFADVSNDPATETIEIAECVMLIDINEDGIAEMMKITVAGGDNPTHVLDMEEMDEIPFISTTAILMSHKLFGLSLYDRLKQIQELKTTLWRNILDNTYLQNNQRTIVLENQVNLDDLLISRPGGIIRAKTANAVTPYVTPPLSPDVYKMMDYADQVREGRAGVSPNGPVTDTMIGDRVGSEGVAQMMAQKEELVGLMVRVIAETGIKPLCYMIRDQVIKHQDVAREYMFRGKWVQVSPTRWRDRVHSTVRVGTGSGNRKEQVMAVGQLIMFQQQLIQKPGQALVMPEQQFNAMNDYAKFSGLPGAGKYILDPKSPEGKKAAKESTQQQQEIKKANDAKEQAVMELQKGLAAAEQTKAAAAMLSVKLKEQIERLKTQISGEKVVNDAEMAMLKQQLAEAEAVLKAGDQDEEMVFRYWDRKEYYELERDKLESQEKQAEENAKDQPTNG
ncbi:MAG: hypothetical protein DRQ89_12335 [Epsilonproteobacteria bacterium]|nr:MAG: hypothetical protein DRQ89_12335 [Campylobacterota bacterium]